MLGHGGTMNTCKSDDDILNGKDDVFVFGTLPSPSEDLFFLLD